MTQSMTISVIMVPPTHTATNEAAKYKIGDIVQTYLTSEVPENPNLSGRFAFCDIPDVPDDMVQYVHNLTNTPVVIVDGEEVPTSKRQWYIDKDLIPADRWAALQSSRRGPAYWLELLNITKQRGDDALLTEQAITF